MKSEINKGELSKELNDKIKKIIPEEFEILDLAFEGKKVLVNMRELLEISDCENPLSVMETMNHVSAYLFTFGSIMTYIESKVIEMEEKFEEWLAIKASEFKESSEKGKERCVVVKYTDEYNSMKEKIRRANLLKRKASIAYDTIKKSTDLIQSISWILKSEREKGNLGVKV